MTIIWSECVVQDVIFSYKFYSYELVTDTKMTEIRVTVLSNHKVKYNMIESNNTVHKEYMCQILQEGS